MRCANLSLRYKGLPENDPKIAVSLCNFSYRLLVCGPRQFTALSWFEQKCVNSCYTLDKRIKYTENPFTNNDYFFLCLFVLLNGHLPEERKSSILCFRDLGLVCKVYTT